MCKVSIILAVYNVEKYLRQCLDSLVNQTLQDIEIICTDDGSTDNSLNILKEYQSRDNRIKIIEQENQGPGIARNNALDIATGKYIMIVDPDDWIELEACELAYNQIEKNQNDLVIFDFRRFIDETGEYINRKNSFAPYENDMNNAHINVTNLKTNFIQNGFAWNKIYNKDFLQKLGLKFLPQYLCEEDPFALLSLIQSKNLSILNQCLYNYRIRTDSSSFKTKNWQEIIYAKRYVANYIKENKFSDKICKDYNTYLYRVMSIWYNDFTKLNPNIKNKFRKELLNLLYIFFKYSTPRQKIKYYMYKCHLNGIYYGIIRPACKYCIVLPYRWLKAQTQGI